MFGVEEDPTIATRAKQNAVDKSLIPIILTEDGFIVDEIITSPPLTDQAEETSVQFAEEAETYAEAYAETTEPPSLHVLFQTDRYLALYELAWQNLEKNAGPHLHFLQSVSHNFHNTLAETPGIELLREQVELVPDPARTEDFLRNIPFMQGEEFITPEWVGGVFGQMLPYFRTAISQYPGTVANYYESRLQDLAVPERIFFHLVENKKSDVPFAFMATYSEKVDGRLIHRPLKEALEIYEDRTETLLPLLAPLMKIEKESLLIRELLASGELFYPLHFTKEEAYAFLKEIPIFEKHGVKCRVPNWVMTKRNTFTSAVRLNKPKARLGKDELLAIQPELRLGDEIVTPAEIASYLQMTEGLHLIKNRWVEVDHNHLRRLLADYEKLEKTYANQTLSPQELLKLGIQASLEQDAKNKNKHEHQHQHQHQHQNEDAEVPVVSHEIFLRAFRDVLKRSEQSPVVALPETFQGQLRPYQEEGRKWLHRMTDLSLGICLADDMGLGKTIQILAYLDEEKGKGKRHLLVLPTSLLGNWEEEIKSFAPTLPYTIYHGGSREISPCLTITTYGTVRTDETLKAVEWETVILDEAQAIKNPSSKQTQAVKNLQSQMHIAMTGTPVENDLMDLYSLFDFINPGLLGTKRQFGSYVKSVEDGSSSYQTLRNVVSPFILRRLKTDRSIIKDLPDKVELNEYVDLTNKQTVLYRKVLADLEHVLAKAEGIDRKGIILQTLLHLKQILNHPSQYSGDQAFKPSDSNKFVRLGEICETIYERREKVLIFTQYREMTAPLAKYLETIFKKPGLVLHGGSTPEDRTEMVKEFNAKDKYVPFMVLSLKAGGTGLNLTGANHVIHFDRWWNPAVENQATDRAFRIGQKKNVFVYKFISRGSVEEKIDELIAGKTELADTIIQENKAPALTELSTTELMDLFTLS